MTFTYTFDNILCAIEASIRHDFHPEDGELAMDSAYDLLCDPDWITGVGALALVNG